MRLSFKALTIAPAFLIVVSVIVGVYWTWDWVPGLIAKLRDPRIPDESKIDPIRQLVRIGDTRAVEPIIELLVGPQRFSDWDYRKSAVMALGMLGDSRAFDPLLGVCHDTKEELWVRLEALRAIGHVRHTRSFEVVRRALDDPSDLRPLDGEDGHFQSAAIWGLAGIGDSASIDILKSMMAAGHELNWVAACALVSTHDPGAIDAVISECQREHDSGFRYLVACAFVRSTDPWVFSQISRIPKGDDITYDELARDFLPGGSTTFHEYSRGKPMASLKDPAFRRALRKKEAWMAGKH